MAVTNITAMEKEEVRFKIIKLHTFETCKIYLYFQVGTTMKILATTLVVSIFAIPTLPESNFLGESADFQPLNL